ncbi:MAG: class I SAM-dependent DNA methyltransferase [Eubacteriaceae bacterium]|jgi:ubiquinone/menaquinone biosynthesis C-methylase UbiE
MYEEFAAIYDSLMAEVDYDEWADYLYRQLLNGKRETRKILEFGCGTGSITTRLAEKGFEMTAVDLSEEMLTVADEKAAQQNLPIRFYLGDMASFTIGDRFDAVLAACDSVNYLGSLEEVQSFAEGAFEALEPGGMLLFDMNTSEKYKNTIADKTFVYDLDDVYCVWESDPVFAKNKMNYNLTFFIPDEDGRYIRADEQQTQYIYNVENIYQILRDAGYKDIKLLTFGTFETGSNESERVQFVAVKP